MARVLKSILTQGSLSAPKTHFLNWIKAKRGDLSSDIYNKFDFLMDISEKNGVKSAFYFIAGKTSRKLDANYNIHHPLIKKLIKHIHIRGHELGIHPSYHTFLNGKQTQKEFSTFKELCNKMEISVEKCGGRQHILRWQVPQTWQNWEDAKLSYDGTLSFADHPGFRCGICYEYKVFNLETKRPLKLQAQPLVLMECSLIDERYLGYGLTQKALDYALELKRICEFFKGDFTILWHNSRLVGDKEKKFYEEIIKG